MLWMNFPSIDTIIQYLTNDTKKSYGDRSLFTSYNVGVNLRPRGAPRTMQGFPREATKIIRGVEAASVTGAASPPLDDHTNNGVLGSQGNGRQRLW